MKFPLTLLFILACAFCAPAACPTTNCDEDQNSGEWTIQNIRDCPQDKPCTRKKHHHFDPELDKLKNISSDDQQPVLRTIQSMKNLGKPKHLIECGSRDELKQSGEGQKITVLAWALTAKPGSAESANCDLPHHVDQGNHIVLVDTRVKKPTLAKD